MENFKGIQGDWEAILVTKGESDLQEHGNPNRILIKSDYTVIAEVNRVLPREVVIANATLIESAPELLETCIDVLDNFEINQIAREKLMKVISKALGK